MINKCLRKIAVDNDPHLGLPDDTDWETFCRDAVREGVASILYPFLRCQGGVPSDTLEKLQTDYENALLYKDFSVAWLGEVQSALCKHGRVVLLQGLALWDHVYREPLARTMSDIDLLLPDGNLTSVRECLVREGFEQYLNYDNTLVRDGFYVDLHTDPWGCDRIPLRRLVAPGLTLQFVHSKLAPGFHTLAPHLLPVHAAFHGLKHGFARRVWSFDLLLMRHNGLWHEEADMAAGDTLLGIAREHLVIAGLLDKQSHASAEAGQKRHVFLVRSVLRSRGRSGMGEVALALACRTWTDTVRYFLASLLPSSRVMSRMYGDRPYLFLLIARIWRLVKGIAGRAA